MKLEEVVDSGDATILFMDFSEFVKGKLSDDAHDALLQLGSKLIQLGFDVKWEGKMNSSCYLTHGALQVTIGAKTMLAQTEPNSTSVSLHRLNLNPNMHTEIVAYGSIAGAAGLDFKKIAQLCERLHLDAMALRKLTNAA